MTRHFGVVLAGGLSTRMGSDKSQLTWQGETLLQHAYHVLASSDCDNVYISNNKGAGIYDRFTKCGPLGGIDAILQQITSGGWLTVLPVDMPLINTDIIRQLQHYVNRNQQACYFEHNFLPCVLPVSGEMKAYIEQQLAHSGDYSMRGLLQFVGAVSINNSEQLSLINTNTPEEWTFACQVNNDNRKENHHVRSQC